MAYPYGEVVLTEPDGTIPTMDSTKNLTIFLPWTREEEREKRISIGIDKDRCKSIKTKQRDRETKGSSK